MFSQIGLTRNSHYKQQVIAESSFYQFIQKDLLTRLQLLSQFNEDILLISDVKLPWLENQLKSKVTYLKPENIFDFAPKARFELIIFPFYLHWVSEIEKFLQKISTILAMDGLFLANFAGAGTLRFLRTSLTQYEEANNLPHQPHISPFIQFEQIAPLLQQAGFVEIIADRELIELEFDSALNLMKVLQSHGQANALNNKISYSINQKLYHQLAAKNIKKFTDQINLISFIAANSKNKIKLNENL